MRSSLARVMVAVAGVASLQAAFAAEPLDVEVAERDVWWRPVAEAAPRFTPQALVAGLEGCFVVEYVIDGAGDVVDAAMLRSRTGFAKRGARGATQASQRAMIVNAQTEAVLAAVRGMRFEPGERNQARQPIRTTTLPLVFTRQDFQDPGNPEAVRREQERVEQRSQQWFSRCTAE